MDLGEIALHEALIPPDGYQADVEDEERGLENPVMHGWYRYDWTTHVVSSKNHTYAVRSADGEHTVLLVILSYYCEDRSAACVTIRYVEGE